MGNLLSMGLLGSLFAVALASSPASAVRIVCEGTLEKPKCMDQPMHLAIDFERGELVHYDELVMGHCGWPPYLPPLSGDAPGARAEVDAYDPGKILLFRAGATRPYGELIVDETSPAEAVYRGRRLDPGDPEEVPLRCTFEE